MICLINAQVYALLWSYSIQDDPLKWAPVYMGQLRLCRGILHRVGCMAVLNAFCSFVRKL